MKQKQVNAIENVISGIIAAIIIILLNGLAFMLAWNHVVLWLVPTLPKIGYWMATGAMFLFLFIARQLVAK